MTDPAHWLLEEIPRRLAVEDDWVHHTAKGTSFVVTETGVWLPLTGGSGEGPTHLHVEVRVAVDVTDSALAQSFCDERNHLVLVGRWFHDPQHRIVAIAADIPLLAEQGGDDAGVATEVVGELLNAASTVQYCSAPQRDLAGAKAIPAVQGRIRTTRGLADEYLPRVTFPAGEAPDAADEALILAQDGLILTLLDWYVEHDERETVAERPDGARLVLQVRQHPHAGWGVVISGRPSWNADLAAISDLNGSNHRAGLTRWTRNDDWVENRVFLPNALLRAAGEDVWASSRLVVAVLLNVIEHLDDHAARASALERPVWPADELAADHRRREPWNDGRPEDDPEWYAIYLDEFGRMGNLTEPSYRRWLRTLRDADRDSEPTAGFVRFMEARLSDRNIRSGNTKG